jgi:RNA-directed DNA polymerase
MGWRDSLQRIFGKASGAPESSPRPPDAREADGPGESRPLAPSPELPSPGQAPVEAREASEQPAGPAPVRAAEHRRRRVLRDPRLVPRPKGTRLPLWLVGLFRFRSTARSPHAFEAGEVRRLSSPTMRTRNRAIRDLIADEERLAHHGLPIWRTEGDLAESLGIPVRTLRYFSIHRDACLKTHYVAFTIPRKSGEPRVILAPKRKLKEIQRDLLELLVRRLPVSDHAHGFRADRSIATNAAPHVGRAVVMAMDLKDFFPSVTFARVRGFLIAMGYGYRVATTLAVLMTECERRASSVNEATYQVATGWRYCPQGAPTSPGLCNAVALRLDRRLAGLAAKLRFSYTRYADDLSFSGDDPGGIPALRRLATRIIEEEGFRVNEAKTRIMRRGSRQTVTGVVVNEVPGLSRQERRRIRAIIHQTGKPAADPTQLDRLRGKLAYLAMLNPGQAAALRGKLGGS